MKFNVVSLMPGLIEGALQYGVVGAAFKNGACYLETKNPREFTDDNHQTVDDRPFGGGDGMLMLAEPLQQTLNHLLPKGPVFYLSPQGPTFNDELATQLSHQSEVTFICGRYGGVDNRFLVRNRIQELSLGDFVLSGGEFAALAMIDSVVRKIPGVLGHSASASEDSFQGGVLEAPHFTRPQEWEGLGVPAVLLSGNHKKIHEYKTYMNLVTTLIKRPELLRRVRAPWESLLKYLETMPDKDWQGTGFDREKVIMLVKDRIDE